ncbi:hypothetical protein [Pseudomonas sp. K5002]|uniref:hypothetical protein n=1 Tax=Pseudomonas sp. K5002 TaxID=2738828 RepID=UPI0015BF090E|nr:hypothetical protein [Pseudomonas sp. K5002]NWD85575.1 hypothetical protein [Pseudomonas sp. K5002]
MNITFILIAVIVCFVSAVSGLTAGINMNPSSTVKYVWDWGVAGSWVSGIGALIAVLSTIYLHRRSESQQVAFRKDKIEIRQGSSSSYVLICFTSHSHYTSKVRGVWLTDAKGTSISLFGHDLTGTEAKLPITLDYKGDFQLEWHVGQMRPLLMAINTLQCESIDDLKVEVNTTIESFVVSLDPKIIEIFRKVSSFENIRIEK